MKKLFLLFLVFACITITKAAAKPEAASVDTVRIHPIGDSITRGVKGDVYRHYLKTRLKDEAGININFVGQCPHAADALSDWTNYQELFNKLEGDIEHDGWGGLKMHEIMDMTANTRGYPKIKIEEMLSDNPSDIILLMIGTNDIIAHYLLAEAPARFETLVTRILDATTAHLIVSTVPPTPLPTPTRRIDSLNTSIRLIVDSLITAGRNLSLVDINTMMDSSDVLDDAYHPNSKGYLKISNAWYDALMPLVTDVEDNYSDNSLPEKFNLLQNYPNPFNPVTRIQFSISEKQFTTLKVYDILGKEVATLFSGEKSPGEYAVEFLPENQASGVYICQLKSGNFIKSVKMIYMK